MRPKKKVDENVDSLHIIVLCSEKEKKKREKDDSYLFSVSLVVLIILHLSQ